MVWQTRMEPTEEEKAKARRAIRVIYALMALGILLPLVIFLLQR